LRATRERPLRILHAHSTFSLGGKEARAARLMNAFGDTAEHAILSAMPGALGARDAIDPAIAVDFPVDAPSLQGRPELARYLALADYMRRFDLVLSYNWGAMDVVMAHRLFRATRDLPPLVHHEDGFNEDESVRRDWKRNLFRRIALKSADALVVPSQTLARIARREWRAAERLHVIANGIATERYAAAARPGAIPGFARRDGDVVIGTVAGLRAVKNLPLLVAALARLPDHVRLVIVGEGPERAAIVQAARDHGVEARVALPGFLPDPWRYFSTFDIFSLSSLSEQAPISLIEAMAAGLPVAACDVGDVRAMLPVGQSGFIAPPRDAEALARALSPLVDDAALRGKLGKANQGHARDHFDEAAMIAAYARLYDRALGDDAAFVSQL